MGPICTVETRASTAGTSLGSTWQIKGLALGRDRNVRFLAMDSGVVLQRASSSIHDLCPADGFRSRAWIHPEELHFGFQSRSRLVSCRNPRFSAHRPRRLVLLCSQNLNGLATQTDASENGILGENSLKTKGKDVAKDLKGTCLFLIGMMGSGKSTVGKLLSEALGYYFFDSDKLVEQAAGGASVAQIFQQSNEEGFRDAESEVLNQLSGMFRLVVATGGGAVVRPQNWSYLRHGITIYLDVPLEALAKRVVAAGTEKRPLLGQHAAADVAHEQALALLKKIYEDRGKAYQSADVTVSIQKVADERGIKDLKDLTPAMIALEVLEQTHQVLQGQKHYGKPRIGLL